MHGGVDVRDVDALLLLLVPDHVAEVGVGGTGHAHQACEQPTGDHCRNRETLHHVLFLLIAGVSGV